MPLLGKMSEIEILTYLDMMGCVYDLPCAITSYIASRIGYEPSSQYSSVLKSGIALFMYMHRCAERVFALFIKLYRSSRKAYNAILKCRVTGVVRRTTRVDDSVTQKQNVRLCILFVPPLSNIQLVGKISAFVHTN